MGDGGIERSNQFPFVQMRLRQKRARDHNTFGANAVSTALAV